MLDHWGVIVSWQLLCVLDALSNRQSVLSLYVGLRKLGALIEKGHSMKLMESFVHFG
jgi:hypothetical protein